MESKKLIKYQVCAHIGKLSIKKNMAFTSKIIWKRHKNKTQTKQVTHSHGFSIFNQTLQLELSLSYDASTKCFEDKNTQFLVIISLCEKTKSGGYIKYNIAKLFNEHLQNSKQMICLTQCPDPEAYIEVSFQYRELGEGDPNLSALNASSLDLNYSRVDFKEDARQQQMNQMSETLGHFRELVDRIKSSRINYTNKIPELKTQLQILEGQKKSLEKQILKLEGDAEKKQRGFKQERKELEKQVKEMEKQFQRKSKVTRSKDSEQQTFDKNKENQSQSKYKALYEEAIMQVNQLRGGQAAELIKKKNQKLESDLSLLKYKLAQLFNASYQYGGADLSDYLQTAIGITETNK